jgi:hypothetical protein
LNHVCEKMMCKQYWIQLTGLAGSFNAANLKISIV